MRIRLPPWVVAPAGPEGSPRPLLPSGLWLVTVSGRKHSVWLCSPRQAEAERWGVALREVIASKAPLETPTQLLLRDIQVGERELHGEGGGWGAPFSIAVTLSSASRRVAGIQRPWPSFTDGTLF